jgi:hypothetical protein
MKCSTHQTVDAVANCSNCNSPLCDTCIFSKEGDVLMCARCSALSAVTDFGTAEESKVEQDKQVEVDKENSGGRSKKVQVAIIAIALFIVPIQFYNLLKGPKPYVIDKTDLEEVTDFCILNLWKISEQLQQGILPGKEFRCPFGGQTYIVTHTEDDIIVSDPNPKLHDHTEFRVSKKEPVPVLF